VTWIIVIADDHRELPLPIEQGNYMQMRTKSRSPRDQGMKDVVIPPSIRPTKLASSSRS